MMKLSCPLVCSALPHQSLALAESPLGAIIRVPWGGIMMSDLSQASPHDSLIVIMIDWTHYNYYQPTQPPHGMPNHHNPDCQ